MLITLLIHIVFVLPESGIFSRVIMADHKNSYIQSGAAINIRANIVFT